MFQFTIVLSIVFLMVFCPGCGKKEESKTVLRLWHIMNYSGPREVLEDAVARFESRHPGVKVEVETFSNDDYKTKLALEMASGNEPDVFFNWGAGGQTGQYIAQNRIADLTAFADGHQWNSRFIDAAMNLCRKDDKLYCAPLDMSVVVLWCNGALFEKNGLTPPKTWSEFIDVCKTLKSKDITPLSLGNYDAWPGAFYFCYLANRLGGTQLFVDAAAKANGATFANEEFVKAGEGVQALVNAGVFNKDFAERKEDEARKMFVRGRSAMYLGGSWLVGQIVGDPANEEFLKTLVPIAFPALPNGKGDARTMLGGVNCGFSVSAKCANQPLAMELIDELTGAETAKAWCAIGRIPASQAMPEWTAKFPAPTKQVYELLKDATGIQPYYDQYLQAEVTVEHKNTTRDLFNARITPEEAAKKMAAK